MSKLDRMRPAEEVLQWDEFFMGTAFLAAMRSKDPVTQVGACIVSSDNKIISTGYNGMPRGCRDEDCSWKRGCTDKWNKKAFYVCHAELNAVLNAKITDFTNCRMYVALFPCNECAKVIIQAGIKKVIYYSDKIANKKSWAAKKILRDAGVDMVPYDKNLKEVITINFTAINSNGDDD